MRQAASAPEKRASLSQHEEKQWSQIVLRVFLKLAQVVVQSRVQFASRDGKRPAQQRSSGSWFNIEMEDVKEIEQRVLNTLGMSKSRSPKLGTPVRIDIYMESGPRGARSSKQLLERWSVSLVKSGDSLATATDSLQAGYKKLVILMRAVYTQTRQLPLWSQRRVGKLHYEISTAESVTQFDEEMSEFQFGSQDTPLGTMYLSVWYRKIAGAGMPTVTTTATMAAAGAQQSQTAPTEATVVGSELINSEYFRDQSSLNLERKSSAPIAIASGETTENASEQPRASSLPVQQHFHRTSAAPVLLQEVGDGEHGMLGSDLGSPVNFQPHSLPTRFGADVFSNDMPFRGPLGTRSRGGSVDHNVVSPVLSMSGVAQPMDIPVGKMRRAGSRNSLDEPSLGSSRGTSPSSFGSSFGSSPHNMFAFTPPFASGMSAAAAAQSASPDGGGDHPLVFSETRYSGSTSAAGISTGGFSKPDAETSQAADGDSNIAGSNIMAPAAEMAPRSSIFPGGDHSTPSLAHTSAMFGQFSAEDLPFADPSGPEDHDSKIGSFVEECWNAPALSIFSGSNGQRIFQTTKELQETLSALRDTQARIQQPVA